MRHVLAFALLSFIGCTGQPASQRDVEESSAVDSTGSYAKELVLFDTTFTSKSSEFQVIGGRSIKEDVYAHIIKNGQDTITVIGAAAGIEVRDFNSDGYPDVLLFYLSNNVWIDLYLFDEKREVFLEVKDFNQVSDAMPISGKEDIYYAYQRAGCADANWTSTLFEIRDYTAKKLAKIEATGCDWEEGRQKQGIVVYRIETLDKLVEVDQLPIDTIHSYDEYKRGFIADYWNANLDRFLK